ncbi:MAG TPA: type II secretion system minor pseudopilin GspK [Wenzhouxiangellaceae bacterium]|nr:type II secretion system minor pseudopilin GspK [Wenzhouxiangellaceae bacterium]
MRASQLKSGGLVRQRGAALLIALLSVALAVLLATELVERSQRDVARTTAVVNAERAWQFAEGVEGLARDWIRRQRQVGPGVRLPDGQWSEPFMVPGGSVRGRMFARDGRFNLNALASRDPAVAADGRRTLLRLLTLLNVDPALGESIVAMYGGGGASPATTRIHLSELNRLERFTPEMRRRVEPYLALLPNAEARINVNLALPEVLAAAVEGLSIESARSLIARAPFESLAEVLAQPEFAALNAVAVRRRLAVESEWFLVQAQVSLDGMVRDYFRLVGASGNRYDFRYLSQGVP